MKTPLIRVEFDGEIPQDLLEVVKRDFPEEVEILEGDEEYVEHLLFPCCRTIWFDRMPI